MTDGEKKTSERTPVKKNVIIKILIAAIVFVLFPYLFMYWSMTDNWHIFTQKRIDTIEQYFSIQFPAETRFKNCKRLYGMDGGTCTLYLEGIADMENFCRSCCDTPIKFMANRKNGVTEYDTEAYTPNEFEAEVNHFDDAQEFYGGKESPPDFLCIYMPVRYGRSVYVYGLKNGKVYDVKIKY